MEVCFVSKLVKSNNKGFSLVEIVIVVAILAILSALLVPRIIDSVTEAKVQKKIADARMLASEVVTYNTLAKLEGRATIPNPLPATEVELTKPMLDSTYLELPDDDSFPDTSIVKIYVDSEGNTSLVY